ncbi:unnamed protein product, partial [Rotaria sp. Silwood1]
MPAMVMFVEDHVKAASTGRSREASDYHETIHQHLQNGDMYSALQLELSNMLEVS